MPQLDPASFPSQLFWLALTFIPLFLVLWKVALPKVAAVIAAREARIRDDLAEASRLRDEAKEAEARYEATLKEAHERAREELRRAAQALAVEAAERHAQLARELADNIAAAEARIASARAAAMANIESVAGEAAREATERLIGIKASPSALTQAIAGARGERR